MTGSHLVAALRRFLTKIVSQRSFLDVCAKIGKWFRASENCVVAALATKQFGKKCQQFELDGF
jgi:hypothetical protein